MAVEVKMRRLTGHERAATRTGKVATDLPRGRCDLPPFGESHWKPVFGCEGRFTQAAGAHFAANQPLTPSPSAEQRSAPERDDRRGGWSLVQRRSEVS